MLDIENLGKAFGGLKALKEVNLRVKEKQVCGLIGPNGA